MFFCKSLGAHNAKGAQLPKFTTNSNIGNPCIQCMCMGIQPVFHGEPLIIETQDKWLKMRICLDQGMGRLCFLWYQRGLPGAINVVSLAPNLGVSLKKSLTAMMFTTF